MDINTIHKAVVQNNTKENTQYDEQIEVLEREDEKHSIVIWNDDVNTFDFVIETLMEVCEHNPHQAEQCTWLIHFKGKCDVKSGSIEDLMPRHQELLNRGLTSEIV